jgi:hypothetical protein
MNIPPLSRCDVEAESRPGPVPQIWLLTADQFDEVEIREVYCFGAVPMKSGSRLPNTLLRSATAKAHFMELSFHLLLRNSHGRDAFLRGAVLSGELTIAERGGHSAAAARSSRLASRELENPYYSRQFGSHLENLGSYGNSPRRQEEEE